MGRALRYSGTEFVGSKTCHGKVEWIVAFLLLLHILRHYSIQSVVCPVWSLFEMWYYSGISSQPWKKSFRNQHVTVRGGLWKYPSSAICWAKTWIFAWCLRQNKMSILRITCFFKDRTNRIFYDDGIGGDTLDERFEKKSENLFFNRLLNISVTNTNTIFRYKKFQHIIDD